MRAGPLHDAVPEHDRRVLDQPERAVAKLGVVGDQRADVVDQDAHAPAVPARAAPAESRAPRGSAPRASRAPCGSAPRASHGAAPSGSTAAIEARSSAGTSIV